MRDEHSEDDAMFVEYDDNNIEHVMAGPDYGQPETGSKETAWTELDSKEYPDYVSIIQSKILNGCFGLPHNSSTRNKL